MIEIPPSCQCAAVIGHDAAKAQIEEAFDSGRMHHAWLITGPEGIGKASLAYHLAHLVLSDGENRFSRFNPENPAARLIAAEAHPDMFVLRRPVDEKTGAMKDSISVEDARKIAPFLRMTAAHGKGRVGLIDEAHALGRNAQNAILKVIEEPPPGAVMILTATTVGALLPTIRSRCRVLPLAPLTSSQLQIVLARLGVDLPGGADKERLLDLAHGSVGLALRLLRSEALPLFEELTGLLAGLPTLDMARVHALADKMSKKAEAEIFEVVTSLLVDVLRENVRAVAMGKNGPTALAPSVILPGSLDKALEIWEKTRQTFASVDAANLDRKAAFLTAMAEIGRAASA